MFASAGAALSKIDQSRGLCRKVDLRMRNAERFSCLALVFVTSRFDGD
jgi:hypothetical protein